VLSAFTQLGRYEIVAALGAGGMGEIYRARDRQLGREVAVKILPGPFAGDPERKARFVMEATRRSNSTARRCSATSISTALAAT
jgi:serine/threonine protein kinase